MTQTPRHVALQRGVTATVTPTMMIRINTAVAALSVTKAMEGGPATGAAKERVRPAPWTRIVGRGMIAVAPTTSVTATIGAV